MDGQGTLDSFAALAPERLVEETLLVDLDGYEGPLDVLLALAREQKVDLARISILQLAEQYLDFVARRHRANLELAADYLVMAAWLVFLKSRLLLPEPPGEDEPSGAEMAEALAFQLQRLEAMRQRGAALMHRPRLGRDVFSRGEPERIEDLPRPVWELGIYELLRAYADVKRRGVVMTLQIEAPDLYSPDDALRRLTAVLGRSPGWSQLASLLPAGLRGLLGRSAVAAHFCAALELCRQGRVVLRQDSGAFGALWLRPRETGTGEMNGEASA
jgi:segregation and condensation protein A